MTDYLWSILSLFFVGIASAVSGIFYAGEFSGKWKLIIFISSGVAPIVSAFLVGFRVWGAGPYNIFIDPAVCIVWVALVNFLFGMLSKHGTASNFYVWLSVIALGVVLIRLFVGDVWS